MLYCLLTLQGLSSEQFYEPQIADLLGVDPDNVSLAIGCAKKDRLALTNAQRARVWYKGSLRESVKERHIFAHTLKLIQFIQTHTTRRFKIDKSIIGVLQREIEEEEGVCKGLVGAFRGDVGMMEDIAMSCDMDVAR